MGREILIFYSMEKNDEYFQDSLTMYNLFKFKYSLMIQNHTLWAKELGGFSDWFIWCHCTLCQQTYSCMLLNPF